MPSKKEFEPLPENPVLTALVDAAAAVGKAHTLKISIVMHGDDVEIIVERAGEPRGDLCLGTALEVAAAAHVAYGSAAVIATSAELILSLRSVRLVAEDADPAPEPVAGVADPGPVAKEPAQ